MMVVGAVVIGGGSFFAGTRYQGNDTSSQPGNFSNMGQPGQARMGQNSGAGMRAPQAGGITMGEILSKDDSSITVKLPNGGSKIVFFSESTTVNKSTAGSIADLAVSENVVVNGSANTDGSINAQSIQLGLGIRGF